MPETIELLFVNVPDANISSILTVFRIGNIEPVYSRVNNKEELIQEFNRGNNWDLILLSQPHGEPDFSLVEWINSRSEKVPVIYIAEDNLKEVTLSAVKAGATDCLSNGNLIRLLPIAKREAEHNREREHYEQALARKTRMLKKQQKRSQQNKKKNSRQLDLLANTVHDMRTLLNSVILSSKLLIKDPENHLKKEQTNLAKAIHQSGNHLLRYVDNFLESPNKESVDSTKNIRKINLQSFCQNICRVFLPVAREKNLTFNYELHDLSSTNLKVNILCLERILTNILTNAFKYTPTGEVTFTAFYPDKENLPNKVPTQKEVIAFTVKDTGIGIPEEEQEQIFKRRHRVHQQGPQKYQGNGLGLSICRKLTDVLGGELQMESRPGEGSTFTLMIPVEAPADNPSINPANKPTVGYSDSKKKTDDEHPSGNSKTENEDGKIDKTVLIIDDSRVHNLAIKEFLTFKVTRCITATSAEEAFSIINSHPVDCIVMDLVLPNASGLEIAAHIRDSKHTDIPLIIYTGKKLTPEERNAANEYADVLIKKTTNSYNILMKEIISII